ncbi:hypothetical protein [Ectothiorhodospira shaposhnikovii]|uniref:hypothetical protein n=1 Tax=Ectothiorhodospira shaposhnikovii TaxID=1054 RepID=UPI001EE8B3BA|nr:hypothetical protein [Ectothiorhodospira shaposhnikovii]MCG5512823.1 hypothetical protein [Ectothiorhodospira shaposhnikovii]
MSAFTVKTNEEFEVRFVLNVMGGRQFFMLDSSGVWHEIPDSISAKEMRGFFLSLIKGNYNKVFVKEMVEESVETVWEFCSPDMWRLIA